MTFREWFNSTPHRAKYSGDHPAYLAAQEAWEAAHEACAKVCDEREEIFQKYHTKGLPALCADAIRARGDK